MVVNIALDGPSGSGKSTMAKRISKELGYAYIDTGALYRALALFVKRAGIDPGDEAAVASGIKTVEVGFHFSDGVQRTYLNGEDVSELIRSPEISDYASRTSSLRCVRAKLLAVQRDFAAVHSLIMDGRDIGTTVLPDAPIKLYLTADAEDRAQRRYAELLSRGEKVDFATVLSDIQQRDARDMTREISPLRRAEDAVLVETTGLSLEEGYQKVKSVILSLLEKL